MRKRNDHTPLIVRLFNKQEGRCAYCGEPMLLHPHDSNHPKAATKDHVIPRSKGGVSDVWNIVAADRECNCRKGNLPLIDYLDRITNGRPHIHPMFYHPALKQSITDGRNEQHDHGQRGQQARLL